MSIRFSLFAKLAAKDDEVVKDFVWTSARYNYIIMVY